MQPYNPLDKRNLGRSVTEALLQRPLTRLPAPKSRNAFTGAGVYAIYYLGREKPFAAYEVLVPEAPEEAMTPIYVGKAIPAGARTAGVGIGIEPGTVLFSRLREHASSIASADNLELDDFVCRYLLVDDIWIPLGESLLIRRFRPVWNVLIDGFGNHDPGGGRRNQQKSAWDTIHPGRTWADKLHVPNSYTPEQLESQIRKFLAGEDVPTKSVDEAMEDER
jgi:hypothetical protein